MRSFVTLGLIGLLAVGCAASEPAGSSSEQDVIGGESAASLADVTVEQGTLRWGRAGHYSGKRADVEGVHAYLFEGEAGDAIAAQLNGSGSGGTGYILAKTASGFSVVSKTTVPANTYQTELKAQLTKAGIYAIAFDADVANDPDEEVGWPGGPKTYGFQFTLTGAPASAANKLTLAVRHTWADSTDFSETESAFEAIAPAQLPKDAAALFAKWNTDFAPEPAKAFTWKMNDADVFVVQSYHDNGLSIAFYDPSGAPIGEGSALEDSDFYWSDSLGL